MFPFLSRVNFGVWGAVPILFIAFLVLTNIVTGPLSFVLIVVQFALLGLQLGTFFYDRRQEKLQRAAKAAPARKHW